MTETAVLELSRDEIVGSVDTLAITTKDHYAQGGEIRKQLADLRREIKATTEPVVKAAHAAHKAAKAQENELLAPIKDAEDRLGSKMGIYIQEQKRAHDAAEAEAREQREAQEAEARAAEESARKERDALEEKALKEAQALEDAGKSDEAEKIIANVPEVTPLVVEAPEPIKIPDAEPPRIAGTRRITTWKFEIIDPSKVPDVYKTIDDRLIAQHVRTQKDKTAIPGVRVYPEVKVTA